MNEDRITVIGVVGSDPRPIVSAKGLPVTTFRLASSPRVFNRESGEWRDGETNWYTVSAFRRLAENVAFSVRKGEHIVVTGKFRLRSWQTADKQGTAAEIDADAIGHDLSWAVTRPHRVQASEPAIAAASESGADHIEAVVEGLAPVALETGEVVVADAADFAGLANAFPVEIAVEPADDIDDDDAVDEDLDDAGRSARSGVFSFGTRR